MAAKAGDALDPIADEPKPKTHRRRGWRLSRSSRDGKQLPLFSNVISSLALLASLGTFFWTQHQQTVERQTRDRQQVRVELESLLQQYQNLATEFVERSKGLTPTSIEFAALQSRMANQAWSLGMRCDSLTGQIPEDEISAFQLGLLGNLSIDTARYAGAKAYLVRAIAKANEPLLRAAIKKDLGRLHYLQSPLHDPARAAQLFAEAIVEAGSEDVGAKTQKAFFYETWALAGVQDDGLEASQARLRSARGIYEDLWKTGMPAAHDAQLRIDAQITALNSRLTSGVGPAPGS